MEAISVRHLVKEFSSPIKQPGPFYTQIKNYLFPKKSLFTAVNDLSFSIHEGEKVAFIGPNGAGKSTTIKMMTGIIRPTRGEIFVLGKRPAKDRKKLSYEISALFGHASKLWFHLPVKESLQLLAAIYDIPKEVFQRRLKNLVDRFEIGHLLSKPARQLSLGERMRCEIVASFLHAPKVLFLDEPTIGLDLLAKTGIRDLLCKSSKEEGITLILTSHDTSDIETVCDRVIMLHQGKILFDDPLEKLKNLNQKKVIEIITSDPLPAWSHPGAQILEKESHRLKIEIDLTKTSSEKILHALWSSCAIKDLKIEEPSLESSIRSLYARKV
jgi:ABC-2 type transport system ATP-binding protein